MKRRVKSANHVINLEASVSAMPKERSQYVEKSMAVSQYISDFVNSNEYKQKEIAKKLGKHESEISKWLSGLHNLTLKSIIKLESVCSIKLLNPAIFEQPSNNINPELIYEFNSEEYFKLMDKTTGSQVKTTYETGAIGVINNVQLLKSYQA